MKNKKLNFMHAPTKEPKLLKWRSKSRVIGNELITIDLETGALTICPLK